MDLSLIENTKELISSVRVKLEWFCSDVQNFNDFYKYLRSNGYLFIVGGFLRDISNKQKSRDLDLITSIPETDIDNIINKLGILYQKNRFGGYKIQFNELEVDLWNIKNNWSFKKEIIRIGNDDSPKMLIEKIAASSFYNFDSLVLGVNSYDIQVNNYNNCLKTATLDIVRRGKNYINNNPTREANIIRAFYLKGKYQLTFSESLKKYILSQRKYIEILFNSDEHRILEVQSQYKKYGEVFTKNNYKDLINGLKNETKLKF